MSITADPVLHRIARFWDARGREDARRYSVPGGAPIDEARFAASGAALVEALGELLGWTPDPDATVVEVGCGAGRISAALAARVSRVIAYDISRTMLAAARDRLPELTNVVWRQGHAGDLAGEPEGAVDAALLIGVLTHLPEPEDLVVALEQAAGAVVSGGAVIFDLRLAPEPLRLPGEQPVPPHVARHPIWQGRPADLETVAAVAHQSGLEIERIAGSETGRCVVLARRP
ncbi:MAG: class I SAM-dependent methyltransferase [Patulibacter sp.]|nr:class I SAM-dependent methyltransferase [Patulibacter sp.]